jgi:hypothetical protein
LLGRCLLRLQQYERLMKAIVAHHDLSGPPHALPGSLITYRVNLDPQGGLELPMAVSGREPALIRFAPTALRVFLRLGRLD